MPSTTSSAATWRSTTTALGGDLIIVRSNGTPLYHFTVCVDDADMAISHVIRGEDHLSNTPKHILLFRAMGAPLPQFAHLPLILNPDRTKMSKRKSQTAVADYRAQGYIPEAFVNFLALLGWAPSGTEEEIFSHGRPGAAFLAGAGAPGRRGIRQGAPRVAQRPVDPQADRTRTWPSGRCHSSCATLRTRATGAQLSECRPPTT